jgi:hypothetical protein
MDRASPGGWTCAPTASGATCTHGPLAADASTTSYLQVLVAADTPPGHPSVISVDSGGRQVTARGTTGVSAGGFPARFAASGRYSVTTAGTRLGGGDCARAGWDLRAGSPRCPAGRPGGRHPRPVRAGGLGGPVLGLDGQSAAGRDRAARSGQPYPAGHRNRGHRSTRPGFRGLARVPVHQAFADMTGLVAQYGSGTWSATAQVPRGWPGWPPGAQAAQPTGADYLGWTLVVVTGDSAAPSGQVMVLDGAHPVDVAHPGDAAHPGLSVPLGGLLTGQVVRVHTVAWTGYGTRSSAFT